MTTETPTTENAPLQAVCDAAVEIWIELNQHAAEMPAPIEAHSALSLPLTTGFFRYCRAYCETHKPPRRLKRGSSADLQRFINGEAANGEVFLEAARSTAVIAGRAVNLQSHLHLMGPDFRDSTEYQSVIEVLTGAACILVKTGAIRRLDDSLLLEKSRDGADRRLARVIIKRSRETLKAASALTENSWAKKNLAQAMNLAIFSPVETLLREVKERRDLALLELLREESRRHGRSLYCEISLRLEEMASVYTAISRRILELQRKQNSTRGSFGDGAEINDLTRVNKVIGHSLSQILVSGFLVNLPR